MRKPKLKTLLIYVVDSSTSCSYLHKYNLLVQKTFLDHKVWRKRKERQMSQSDNDQICKLKNEYVLTLVQPAGTTGGLDR